MSADAVKTVGVLGAGTMGNGIAHTFAKAGFKVLLRDVKQELLDRAHETIAQNLDREVKKEKIATSQKPIILAASTWSPTSPLSPVDFAVEAVPEILDLKTRVLKDADSAMPKYAVLATNTSSISITALGAHTSRPERFIGMHFMNPVPVMLLVEVIRGLATSDATIRGHHGALRKTRQEAGGGQRCTRAFVSNRVLMPLIKEAAFCVMESVATPEGVDAVMKLGMNHPMGPLELADFIGLDVCVRYSVGFAPGIRRSRSTGPAHCCANM